MMFACILLTIYNECWPLAILIRILTTDMPHFVHIIVDER